MALGFIVAFIIACDGFILDGFILPAGFIFVAGFIAGLAMWPDMWLLDIWLLAMCGAGVEVAADAAKVAAATRVSVKIAFFMPLVRRPRRFG